MKRLFAFVFVFVSALPLWAQNWPVALPNLGNYSLKVCHQNLRNYFVVDLTASRSSCSSVSALETKTQKVVQSLRHIDADIYALCELEVNDSVLAYLTNAMNADAGSKIYSYVKNNLTGDNTVIMSGFIYRNDKVKTVGSVGYASTQTYYKRTMRVQAWQEISSGEKFILSENHFKAKDSTTDQGESKREKNAQDLVSKLKNFTADPDILITGDLNETTSESAVSYLVQQGYAEQLEQFNTNPYSYYYSGSYQLIDHALANSTMASQITGAGVFHINTGTRTNSYYSSYWYSDHDAVVVGLRLGKNTSALQESESSVSARKILRDGQILILRDGQFYTLTGIPLTLNR